MYYRTVTVHSRKYDVHALSSWAMVRRGIVSKKYPYMNYYLLVECWGMLWVITICTSLSLWYRVIFSIFSVDCIFFCQLIFVNSSKFWWQAQLWGIAQSLQSILQLLRTFLKNYIGGLKILFVSEPTHKYIYRHIHKEISCSCILGLVKESFLIYDMLRYRFISF